MPSVLPDGQPAPRDGSLPVTALQEVGSRPFGIYWHVPFCASRCGYCDFNTYTVAELGGGDDLVRRYAVAALSELDQAATVLGRATGGTPEVSTVFFGGGTPTLLDPVDLACFLAAIADRFDLASDAEVTVEANPETVTVEGLQFLAEAGFTRISLGMQSAVVPVLATLERTHRHAKVAEAVAAARSAGLQVSLDLIYGTPGESMADWDASLAAAVALHPDHLSAYALVVEEGTALARRVGQGLVPPPQDDDEAAKYERADAALAAAGYSWYEVSNFAARPSARCRHNELYWRSDHWWGIGPGAHSHVGGVRWWNHKHPRLYAQRIADGTSPAAAREVLTREQRRDEEVLLGMRLADGLSDHVLDASGSAAVSALVAEGLIEADAADQRQRLLLTLRGRLLADLVVRRLLGLPG
ncbi:MAG: radical SAM family heme chaperone HemW [Nostocoides sp.]